MKLTNSTDWPDWFLRRMVAWCCKQIQLPPSRVSRARFGNRSHSCWSGRGGRSYGILVRIGPAHCFPVQPYHYPGRTRAAFLSPYIADRVEALVAVTAHELTHVREHNDIVDLHRRRNERVRLEGQAPVPPKRHWGTERPTMHEERRVLELFRANRDALLAEWNAPPKERAVKPKPTRQERNDAKARKMLAAWERKLKLAKTKVAAYRRKVRYYDRVAAAKPPASQTN